MHPHNPSIYAYAALIQQEMEAKAERRRRLREHRAAAGADEVVVGPVTALRRALGTVLVSAGERVRGAERAASGAHLRPVR